MVEVFFQDSLGFLDGGNTIEQPPCFPQDSIPHLKFNPLVFGGVAIREDMQAE
jgi:hypothetical protein